MFVWFDVIIYSRPSCVVHTGIELLYTFEEQIFPSIFHFVSGLTFIAFMLVFIEVDMNSCYVDLERQFCEIRQDKAANRKFQVCCIYVEYTQTDEVRC